MDKESNIVSLAYWRGEKKKVSAPAATGNAAYASSDYERRISELENKLDKVVKVLAEVAEDTSLNRKAILKLLRLLKDKS